MNDAKHELDFAFGDTASDFDRVLPQQPTFLITLPVRLELNGTMLELNHESQYAKHLYTVFVAALQSEWFKTLDNRSQSLYKKNVCNLVLWLNIQTITQQNKYEILNEFQAWRVNVKEVKPQSSGLLVLLVLLKNGLHSDHIDHEMIHYVEHLQKNTKVSVSDERDISTLSSFFASMPWLREIVGNDDYLKLESPKRLMDSFSIVVATTLLFILERKKEARALLNDPHELPVLNKITVSQKRSFNQSYCRDLLVCLGNLTVNGQPADPLTELIILDCVDLVHRDEILVQWHKSTKNGSIFSYRRPHDRAELFTSPCIFEGKTWDLRSRVEQLLGAWLCAWLMVQPSDIGKLKRNDFVIIKNNHGRPINLQCQYYKGRSDAVHEPPMLEARHIEGQALITYMDQLPYEDSNLFDREIYKNNTLGFSPASMSGRLERLFTSPLIQNLISQNLIHRQSSLLFLTVFNAIAQGKGSNFSSWDRAQLIVGASRSVKTYRNQVERAMPILLFGFQAIKNSAVHARTDRYRDGDLINQNSHTSATEKNSYLTDANQDWVNRNGRITRMVLQDIESYVYRPNFDAASEDAYHQVLRTRVIDSVDNGADLTEIQINQFGRANNTDVVGTNSDDIVVLDTRETVVVMLHYIAEVERQYHALINHALPFFERTVLPTVEWMEYLLQGRLSASVITQGRSDYDDAKTILPELFSNELRGSVGS